MAATTTPAKQPTPTDRLMDLQQQLAAAKIQGAASSMHLKYARWGFLAAIVLFIVAVGWNIFRPATVVHGGLSEAQVSAVAKTAAGEVAATVKTAVSEGLAALPKSQPGLTQEEIKNLFAEVFATFGSQILGEQQTIAGQVKILADIHDRLSNLITRVEELKIRTPSDTGLGERIIALEKKMGDIERGLITFEDTQKKIFAELEKLTRSDNAGPTPRPAVVETPAAEQAPTRGYTARDVAEACKGLVVVFKTPPEKMTQAELQTAFKQCEERRLAERKPVVAPPVGQGNRPAAMGDPYDYSLGRRIRVPLR